MKTTDNSLKDWFKAIGIALLLVFGFFSSAALASGSSDSSGLGGVADHVTSSFESIGKLMLAVAYLAGIAFSIAAIFKFKQHKDNPTQIPLGTPIALLVIGICLIFIASFIAPAGETFFGGGADKTIAGGFRGQGATKLPGADGQ